MPLYQMKIDVQKDKVEEFVRNLRTLWFHFLKEEGCLSYDVYREFEKENTFFFVGEFDSHETMKSHFRSRNWEVLIGASNVLGTGFKMLTGEVLEKGGYEVPRSKMVRVEGQAG